MENRATVSKESKQNAAEREICPTMRFIRVKEGRRGATLVPTPVNWAAWKLMTTLPVYLFGNSRAMAGPYKTLARAVLLEHSGNQLKQLQRFL